MNPLRAIFADLRALRWIAWAVPLVVALAVAVGIAVQAQERSLRTASARAADDFDLMIGAPGSPTQLVLTGIYLQPEALPLIDGALINTLAADPRVAAVAPIAFGDMVKGYPVIGTTRDFAGRWGRIAAAEGRFFEEEGEAVIGTDVRLALDDKVTPSHGMSAHRGELGQESEEEAHHRHEGTQYTVVGRLPRLGTPWDRAILIPVETVWETHGLGNGHKSDPAELGAPFDADLVPGVPAIVVKPRAVSDAYSLRAQYRGKGLAALFPAEVLVSLYRTMGDVKQVLVVVTGLNDVIVFVSTLFLFIALVGLRRRRYAVMRALGAPPGFILLTVWAGSSLLLGIGCILGLGLAFGTTWIAGSLIETHTGLKVAAELGPSDLGFAMILLVVGSALSLIPALAIYRTPAGAAMGSQE